MTGTPDHFLVVEDDAVIRRAVGRGARGLMEVRFAETGTAALDALRGPQLPRFVLLDYMLPDLNGLEVLRRLRADPRYADLPILMFSSLQDPARMQETLEAGADAWVPKPDDPVRLRETVRTLCVEWGGVPVTALVSSGVPAGVEAEAAHGEPARLAGKAAHGGNGGNGGNGGSGGKGPWAGSAVARLAPTPGAPGDRHEPSRAAARPPIGASAGPARFQLLWHGHVVAIAEACGGLSRSTDAVDDAPDASDGGLARTSPGRTRFLPVELQGVTLLDPAFEAWAAHLGEPLRRDLVLQACDARGDPGRAYSLAGCWVSLYEERPGPGPGAQLRRLRLETQGWRVAPARVS